MGWVWLRVLRRSAAVAAAVGGYAALSCGGWPVQARPVVQASAPAQGAAQRSPFDAWLREAGIAPGQVGAIALPFDGAPALLAHDAERPLNPASTIKLLTTYAALTLLGPDYRWRTEARLKGLLQGGVLRGDLTLRGGGDPKLVIEDLTEFIARMRAAGLEEIDGDLVIDDAIFDAGPGSVEDFDGDPSQPYNVRPFGALMNFKAVQVLVRPNGTGAGLAFDPPLADVAIDDRVRLLGGPCRYGASGLTIRDGEGGAAGVRVSGSYSRACGEQGAFVAVLDHRRFIHGLFKAAWQAAGGRWTGRTRIERGASTGEPWLVWTSPRTLADVVHDINKFSNNVMTRQLMLQMASEAGARPATLADARRVVRGWLAAQGLAFPDLVLDNGAGLSRDARISAGQLARLLCHAAASPYAQLLRTSLPEVGVDGTMKTRFVGEPLAGHAWIKTGSLDDVRSIAGYVQAGSGRWYAVAMIVNGPGAAASRALQDTFLRWVHANG